MVMARIPIQGHGYIMLNSAQNQKNLISISAEEFAIQMDTEQVRKRLLLC